MNDLISFEARVESVSSTSLTWRKIHISSRQKFEGGYLPQSIANKKFIKPIYYADIYGENLPLIEGLHVKLNCKASVKNGKTFLHCITWEYLKPDNTNSVKSFLIATLGKEKLLSTNKIGQAISRYGAEIVEMFKTGNTNALFPIFCPKGSNKESIDKMEKAIASIQARFEGSDFIAEMSEIGITPTLSAKIMEQLGIHSIDELRQNPYECMKVPGVGFKTCDQIAIAIKAALDSPERIVACTEATMQALGRNTQDLYFDATLVKNETLKQLNCASVSFDMWAKAIMDNFRSKEPKFFVRTQNGKTTIMLQEDADNEIIASRKIKALQCDDSSIFSEKLIRSLAEKMNDAQEKEKGWRFTDEQVNAVVRSLTNKVSIITGGPGTGKTTITQVIIKIWKTLSREPITCMAPTGKAATRMSEQTGEKAQTIHKTVKIIPGEENESLEKVKRGLVIIDESSMIDQETLTKMICCIPNGSTVIFLGDINQLPSVGKGDVLRQLIASEAVATSRLTATKRQAAGSPIIDNASKIISGDSDLIYDNKEFKFVQMMDNEIDKFKTLYLEKVKEYGLSQVAVLCPLRQPTKREFKMVSDNLNIYIRDALNPKKADTKYLEVKRGTSKIEFRVGDRVMSWQNKDDVANGDIGLISDIKENEFHEWTVEIKWETGIETTYSREEMEKVSLAYSMSIHKSQGSEYKCVIMPIMSQQRCKLHNRNLIYTGITRAKKECIIVGDKVAIKNSILTNDSSKRNSYLGERLTLTK